MKGCGRDKMQVICDFMYVLNSSANVKLQFLHFHADLLIIKQPSCFVNPMRG